jgi:hypothetical protein
MRTNLTSTPISTLNEQFTLGNIDLQPKKYQRRLVWPFKSKVYLIDSILQGLPIPKFFLQIKVDPTTGKTVYDMVDGQQRMSTIFEFIKGKTSDGNDFILTKKNHPQPSKFLVELEGLSFATLPSHLQQKFWLYKLSMEELTEATDDEIIDMFVRLNLNNAKLTDQEIRNALFQGDFKKMAYELSGEYEDDFYLKYGILSVTNIKRMVDAEFTSELLGSILRGITNKKDKLDDFYRDYDSMETDDVVKTKKIFRSIFSLIESIMGDDLKTTRFNNRSDFYSIFYLLFTLKYTKKMKIEQNIYSQIKNILIGITVGAKADATNTQLLDYFVKTVQGGDTESSRKYRDKYLNELIEPLCIARDPKRIFSESEKQFLWHNSNDKKCTLCPNVIKNYSDCEIDHITSWTNGGRTDLSNGQIAHSICNRKKSGK